MEFIKKVILIIITILGSIFFTRPVYGSEGSIFYYRDREIVVERVEFLSEINTEKGLFTLIGSLIYNRLNEDIIVERVIFDEGEAIVCLSFKAFREDYIGLEALFEQILKTSCSISKVDSIIIYCGDKKMFERDINKEDLLWRELTKEGLMN